MDTFHGRHPRACTLGDGRSRTEQTSRLLIPASLACRRRLFSETPRHSGRLPEKAKASQGEAGPSQGIVHGLRSRRRRGVKCFGSGMTRGVGISVLEAVRVCILGLGARYHRPAAVHATAGHKEGVFPRGRGRTVGAWDNDELVGDSSGRMDAAGETEANREDGWGSTVK